MTYSNGAVDIGPWQSTLLQPTEAPANTPTLICIHGFMGSPDDWSPIARQLLNYRCFALSVPQILSDPEPIAPMAPAGIEAAADALAIWITEHDHTDVHLCGYSLGARILIATLARHPELAPRSLTLLAGNPGLADPQRPARLLWDLQNAQQLRELGTEQFLSTWYQHEVFSSLRDKPDTLRALVEAKADQPAGQLAQQVVAYSPARMTNYWHALPSLTTPTLLLVGEQDQKYTHICQHMAYEMPDAHHRIVPQAGHTMLAETPDAIATELEQFIAEHERA